MKRLVLIIVTLLMFQCGWAEDMVGAWLLPSKNIGGINFSFMKRKEELLWITLIVGMVARLLTRRLKHSQEVMLCY